VIYSKDDQKVGVAHEVELPKTSLNFPRQQWGSIG